MNKKSKNIEKNVKVSNTVEDLKNCIVELVHFIDSDDFGSSIKTGETVLELESRVDSLEDKIDDLEEKIDDMEVKKIVTTIESTDVKEKEKKNNEEKGEGAVIEEILNIVLEKDVCGCKCCEGTVKMIGKILTAMQKSKKVGEKILSLLPSKIKKK